MTDTARAPWPDGIDLDLLAGMGPFGLAVSGGGDSTALAVLLAEAGQFEFTILTVDHRLREGSAHDADAVETLARRLGRPFERLAVTERPEGGSLQAFARTARYRLLREAVARHGLGAVVTAHTLDDQAETFLLRLGRGSGLKGLAAMRPRATLGGLLVLRPLLGARREALRAALSARGITWREDPSNGDPRFDRIAVRNILPRLAAIGLTPERLATTTTHLQRASEALESVVSEAFARLVRVDRAGGLTLARAPFLALPEDVALRVLASAVQRAGGGAYPPRFDALRTAFDTVATGEGRLSLGRAIVDVSSAAVRLWREQRNIETAMLNAAQSVVWDGRYRFVASPDAPRVRIAPIGAAARRCPAVGLPGAIATAPGVFLGEMLVAAPTLGVRRRGWAREHVTVARVP